MATGIPGELDLERQARLKRLEARDWQLWTVAIFVIVGLTAALVSLQVSQLDLSSKDFADQLRSYIWGLPLLIVLFFVHVFQSLVGTRKLRRQLTASETEKFEIQGLLDQMQEQKNRIEASETNFRALLEDSADAMIVADREMGIKFVNKAAEFMLSQTVEELMNQPFQFPLVPHQRSEFRIERPLHGALVADMRVIETRWEGAPALLASLRDITTRKLAEEALQKANDEFKKLDQMKTDFVSTVSHELRTPLTSIKNATNLVASEKAGPINENQKKFLLMTVRNIERLNTIVSDLLDLSKIGAGKMKYKFGRVDPMALVHQVVATFKPQADAGSIALAAQIDGDLFPVFADQARIEQVLCNFLSNAAKFTPAGGKVFVTAKQVPEMEAVEFGVADTGPGLSPEDQKKVFDRFFQTGDSLTRTSKGTGLGLSIAQEMIRAHGGRIHLESEVGRGSRFYFRLPIFSDRTLEMAQFEAEMQQYRDNPCMSLIVLGGPDSLAGKADAWLNRLKDDLRKQLPRNSDRLILQPAFPRLLVLLTGTPKWGAVVVRKKLESVIGEDPAYGKNGFPVPVFCGPVSYPDDGTTAMDLVASAAKSA